MMAHRALLVLILGAALISCKGYREFGEARKELKTEKAERKAKREAEANQSESETAPAVASEKEERFPDSLFFAMAKTPCFGRCPTYEVHLYKSGYATYHGQLNVDRLGQYEARYNPALADTITQRAQEIGIMMLLDSYNNSMITDLPSTIFQIQIGVQKKEVLCRVSCPERLVEFGEEMEELIEQINWKATAED